MYLSAAPCALPLHRSKMCRLVTLVSSRGERSRYRSLMANEFSPALRPSADTVDFRERAAPIRRRQRSTWNVKEPPAVGCGGNTCRRDWSRNECHGPAVAGMRETPAGWSRFPACITRYRECDVKCGGRPTCSRRRLPGPRRYASRGGTRRKADQTRRRPYTCWQRGAWSAHHSSPRFSATDSNSSPTAPGKRTVQRSHSSLTWFRTPSPHTGRRAGRTSDREPARGRPCGVSRVGEGRRRHLEGTPARAGVTTEREFCRRVVVKLRPRCQGRCRARRCKFVTMNPRAGTSPAGRSRLALHADANRAPVRLSTKMWAHMRKPPEGRHR